MGANLTPYRTEEGRSGAARGMGVAAGTAGGRDQICGTVVQEAPEQPAVYPPQYGEPTMTGEP